jgi:hypothetical protein
MMSVAALAFVLLLVLSACASLEEALPDPAGSGEEGESQVMGSSFLHAAADQWQVAFSLMKVDTPWAGKESTVKYLRPGAKAPRHEGALPVNTLIAPAAPAHVGHGGQYGWRVAPDIGIKELHNGADLGAEHGSDVVAAMEGLVRAVFWDVWGGNRVEVAHAGDMVSTYNHLDKVLVEQGDKLESSQVLGTVGQTGSRVTGPHLHFETWVDGKAVDPQSFDWITADGTIRAPRDHAQNPPVIASDGPGDRSTIDNEKKTCPYKDSDPQRCRPPDQVATSSDEGSTRTSNESTGTGRESTPSDEKSTASDEESPPSDEGTTPSDEGSIPSGEELPGAEDCPATAVPEARTDCPPPQWPDLSSAQCTSTSPGVFDCVPVPGTAPGAEDCPAAPVPGARTDCPTTPPALTDPQQCQSTELGSIDCVPSSPVPGAEDCPAAGVPEARTDCPAPPASEPNPNDDSSAPPVDDQIAPPLGAEAARSGMRRGHGPDRHGPLGLGRRTAGGGRPREDRGARSGRHRPAQWRPR